jgi:membrane protein implicated in regulation of membrane protease activity
MEGVVRRDGLVFVRGELWQAQSDRPLHEGEQVQVEGLDGLSLRVRPI